MKLYLIAIIKSKPEFQTEVQVMSENLVVQSNQESACIQYDLHQSTSDNNVFVFYEIWESQAGLDFHNAQAYIKAFVEVIPQKLQEAPTIYITKKI